MITLDSIWEGTEEQTQLQASVTTTSQKQTEETFLTETIEQTVIVGISETQTDTMNDPEQSSLININTATAEELKELNGIGDVIAARIVEYANTSGFKAIEEIKNVKGIGEKKYENIKDKITV